jgi:transposase-like protein
MPTEKSPGNPTTRRYSESEKDQAVRLVRKLRQELGTDHGTVQRVAKQLGYGVESVREDVPRFVEPSVTAGGRVRPRS